jgi:hypothetical protein
MARNVLLYFFLHFLTPESGFRIRIHKIIESGSDPDPQPFLGYRISHEPFLSYNHALSVPFFYNPNHNMLSLYGGANYRFEENGEDDIILHTNGETRYSLFDKILSTMIRSVRYSITFFYPDPDFESFTLTMNLLTIINLLFCVCRQL